MKQTYIRYLTCSSVQLLSCVQLLETSWTAACQASLIITNSWSLLKLMSIESVMVFQPSHPLLPPSPPAFNLSQYQGLFQWVSCWHQVAKVLELQLQSFQWNSRPISFRTEQLALLEVLRDSQESSPTSQFKSIISSALSFLYCPTLTPIHDYQKNHSFDYTYLGWQSNVSAF